MTHNTQVKGYLSELTFIKWCLKHEFEILKGRSWSTWRLEGFEKKNKNRINWDEYEVE